MGVIEVICSICFDHHSESDPDIVFNKNTISQLFAQNVAFT